jgi:hypothetical protein
MDQRCLSVKPARLCGSQNLDRACECLILVAYFMLFGSQLDSPTGFHFLMVLVISMQMNKAKPPRHPKSEDGHPLIGSA